jgi:hypothetical protein
LSFHDRKEHKMWWTIREYWPDEGRMVEIYDIIRADEKYLVSFLGGPHYPARKVTAGDGFVMIDGVKLFLTPPSRSERQLFRPFPRLGLGKNMTSFHGNTLWGVLYPIELRRVRKLIGGAPPGATHGRFLSIRGPYPYTEVRFYRAVRWRRDASFPDFVPIGDHLWIPGEVDVANLA